MEKIKLTVIIPTYNREDILIRTLKALDEQNYDLNEVEALVVDDYSDNSPEHSISKLKTKYRLRFFRMEKNAGAGMVRNQAIDLAQGKYLLFIGDDTIPDKNLIKEHMKLHNQHRGIAVLGQVRWAEEVRDEFMDYIAKIQFHYQNIKDKNNVKFHFYTSNISLEKKWFETEKFSSKFKGYGLEDIEMGYRLERNGLRVIYNSDAIVNHVHHYNFKQFCERMERVGESAAVFADLHPELKRRYIPIFSNALFITSSLLSKKILLGRKLYWRFNFIFNYFKGIKTQRYVEK
ncbi:MAG: glycosyltransferase family 2 protein [Patescibacteria group bacterium]|jgi:GT2 family glycosyltransferase